MSPSTLARAASLLGARGGAKRKKHKNKLALARKAGKASWAPTSRRFKRK